MFPRFNGFNTRPRPSLLLRNTHNLRNRLRQGLIRTSRIKMSNRNINNKSHPVNPNRTRKTGLLRLRVTPKMFTPPFKISNRNRNFKLTNLRNSNRQRKNTIRINKMIIRRTRTNTIKHFNTGNSKIISTGKRTVRTVTHSYNPSQLCPPTIPRRYWRSGTVRRS